MLLTAIDLKQSSVQCFAIKIQHSRLDQCNETLGAKSQSLNLYINNANGKKLDITYRMAWYRGLKTTYYLRALAATSTEKSTVNSGTLNAVSANAAEAAPVPLACTIDEPDCEACQ